MNEFLSRTDQVTAPAAAAPVSHPVVRPVQPASAAADTGGAAGGNRDEAELSAAAEFARAHQKISALLDDLRAPEPGVTADQAADTLAQMLPQPIVIVPLPPASREQMEHAVAVAKSLRFDTMLARAAQAHVAPGTVEAALN